ncbi:MAG TPA: 50S ribosomal protein L3 [Candidatus Uhrbacteria bacterium]|nr:50S ribosomal protein L3 [Candidatus Uhrbacteria bacterium]
MKFILGKKLEMTQKFQADGSVVPVTIVAAGPCFIIQIKKNDEDGYKAAQIGYQENNKKTNKPLSGHLKDKFKAKYLKEFRLSEDEEYQEGQKITVSVFEKGEKVKVSGISKGKGFQGVVKRHGFHGHPTTHGTKDAVRMPGSIGATGAHHVLKGLRMAGRMGGERVTVSNLEIIDIDPDKNLLFIKGAIPGRKNSLMEIRTTGKMDLVALEEKTEKKNVAVVEETQPQKEIKDDKPNDPEAVKEKEKKEEKDGFKK